MGSFSIDLEQFAGKAVKNADQVTRKIALGVFRGVELKTPVKTGRARGNWQVTTGSPASGTVDATDPSGGRVLGEIASKCTAWDPKTGAIYLTNNLPYIERLENGSSTQAPSGMVAVTIAEFGGIADEAAHEVSK